MKYTINELANSKGVSPLVREALLQMEAELDAIKQALAAPVTKDEALDLALEVLEYIHEGANNQGPHTGISWRCVAVKAEPAITAIKQARSAPLQEPVACRTLCELCVKRGYNFCANAVKTTPIPTPPAAQRQWVGLTVDELITLEQKHMRHEDLSRAIEAKLKEKNT